VFASLTRCVAVNLCYRLRRRHWYEVDP